MAFADVERALAALEARGASAFDREGCALVRGLIARAAALPPPAAELLLPRAQLHLERLQERFERASSQARERLEGAEQVHGPLPEQRATLARGAFRELKQELRRLGRVRLPNRSREQQRCEYEAALAEISAQVTVARAVDEIPAYAGPYNPLRIATELLARIGAVSPTYLTAQLVRLEELAIMLTLPAPSPPPSTTPVKKARPSGKRRGRS